MNTAGIITLASANVVAPSDSVARLPVGLEDAAARQELLSPVEQSSANAAANNQQPQTQQEQQQSEEREQQQLEERKAREQQQQQQQQIRQLAAREREVIAHEQAHTAVGGQYAGAPSFSYERGPDGVNYAVAGEVAIKLPQSGEDPEALIRAAEQVQRAALAPADPSAQDRTVAAQAGQVAASAAAELAELRAEEQEAARAEQEQAEREARREEEAEQERQRQEEIDQQRLEQLRQTARRSIEISDQLITLDSLQREFSVGTVVDQRA